MSKNYEERQAAREHRWLKRMEGERVETGCLCVILMGAVMVLVLGVLCWLKYS